jgi:hypothetical protein
MCNRINFAPETNRSKRNERDQTQTKTQQINEAESDAHNGLAAVRLLSEPTTKSIAQSSVASRWTIAPSTGKPLHRQSGLRAFPQPPKTSTIENRGPLLSFFVRRGIQSYDEFIAAVPLRPRLGMMLRMINTSDIFSIGENSTACVSWGRTSVTR